MCGRAATYATLDRGALDERNKVIQRIGWNMGGQKTKL